MKKGITLLLIIGVLALLSVIAAVLLDLSHGQQTTAKNYLHALEARFAAESGFERAVDGLEVFAQSHFVANPSDPWIYYGEDLNFNGVLDPGEDRNHNGRLDVSNLPVEETFMPSFPYQSVPYDPSQSVKIIDGQPRIISGLIEEGPHLSTVYILKAVETSNRIWINSRQPSLEFILNNLAAVLGLAQGIGTQIVQAQRTFSSLADLSSFLGQETAEKIAPYVTFYDWEDPKTIRPKPYNERPWPLPLGQPIPSWKSLMSGPLALEPRFPVNINTAPREVLLALLMNLSGTYVEEPFTLRRFVKEQQKVVEKTLQDVVECRKKIPYSVGTLRKVVLTPAKAEKLVEAILQRRLLYANLNMPAFNGWGDFESFLKEEVTLGVLTSYEMDLVLANANPNTDLNKFNPEASSYHSVDKTDLIHYTTEFTFGPTGIFEIESLGLILSRANTHQNKWRMEASKKVSAVVHIFDMVRWTTQGDFMGGWISPATGGYATVNGKTLQSYPDPQPEANEQYSQGDGQLKLSTLTASQSLLQSEKLLWYQGLTDGNREMKSRRFSDSVDSRLWNRLNRYPLQNSLWADHPGAVYPDGTYVDDVFSPAYPIPWKNWIKINPPSNQNHPDSTNSTSLAQGLDASLSFWMKPSFAVLNLLPRTFFDASVIQSDLTPAHDGVSSALQEEKNFPLSGQSVFMYVLNPLDYFFNSKPTPAFFYWKPHQDHSSAILPAPSTHNSLGQGPSWYRWPFSSNTVPFTPRRWYHVVLRVKVQPPNVSNQDQTEPFKSATLNWITNTQDNPSTLFSTQRSTTSRGTTSSGEGLSPEPEVQPQEENLPPMKKENLPLLLLHLGEKRSHFPCTYPLEATVADVTLTCSADVERLKQEYFYGRFYPRRDAIYLSPLIRLHPHPSTRYRLGTVSWTDNVSQTVFPRGAGGERPVYLSFLSVRVLNAGGRPVIFPTSQAAGSSLNGTTVFGGFHYEVDFTSQLPDNSKSAFPLLDTPILDDLTITVLKDTSDPTRLLFYTEE